MDNSIIWNYAMNKFTYILNLKSIFFILIFSTEKSFWNFLTKYIEQPSYKLIMTEVSKNLRNVSRNYGMLNLAKIPPILKIEVGFFSDIKDL